MAIKVYWQDAAHSIIRFDYREQWTWQEFINAARASWAMADTSTHRVDLIANLTDGQTIPPTGAFGQINAITREGGRHWEIAVIVGVNPVIKTLVRAFKQIYREAGHKYLVADTIEDALTLIAEHRAQAETITEAQPPNR
ncbi:MAG: hypothetical protein GYB67_15445 [Chloroflexi bacterium]|nr:hypothetical protein [Chloroflexota bacterium]